ncbi:uncharacterized protein [Drosophila suzukii]|uniref:Integrase catalytic domain-containing protein n=1 Tax=Drosophila suzukii TaxID=28584 RepID=A0ABM4TXL7_DROSZ
MVKDKLLLPSLVPEVMSTLKMFFGRPEHILERMIDKRWQVAKAGKACFRCLKLHRNNCRPKDCGVNGCTRKHHPLLHSENVPNLANETGNQRHVSTHQGDVEGNQFFRIVPVTLHYDDNEIEVFAFLDEGSSVTLIDASIFDKLGIKGTPSPICLQWTGETTRFENTSVRASIQISGVSSEKRYWLNNVQTVKNIALPKQTVDMDELRSKYSYLKDLPLETYSTQPMLLIGTNNWKIAVPRRIREGKWNDPIASKCMLGWTIQGSANSNRHVSMHHCDCNWRELHDEVKEQFNLESISPKKLLSSEDKRAVEILEQTCQNKCGKYEVGLLWRNDLQKLPESRTTALKRLQCMRSRILSEPDLFTKIDDQIKNLLDKGYAKQLSDEEAKKEEVRTWYLPVFIALNPNKPGKIRLVWDAAAKTNGVCLNDFLLSGPDCLNPLIDVLLAFRVGKVAVSGDIAEMFHRINIRHEDMHSQRFLWYDVNRNKINTYVMRAMTFGINCAPFIAHYVRDKNAEVHRQQFPLALDAIQRAHYVDDFIDSMSDEQKAIEISSQKIWRSNISWDQELPESLLEDWNQWKLLLPQVATFNIPRCYSPRMSFGTRIGLHTFVDASEHAYSAACYLRVSQKDEVDVMLVAAKSKVAPLKPLSIPRMELQAAVMGSRLANKIINVRNLRVDDLTFWSDSRTVLQWLVMDPRNFQQFVMHRIGEVLETTRPPQMAPVPKARLTSFEKPFTCTGVDYFGPILVNVGRRKEKRWVALFTCLTLRAVHFEIAHSLDTSSCVMCFTNFMALRGTPREIYSDNGTNFKATEKALREELIKIDFDKIAIKFDGIKWKFNPPGAPHMGGAWERLVRTTKTVLKSICPHYTFNDESLRCALMEAQFIINSRPLTFVSLDSEDDSALTPNHLLMGSSNGYKPIKEEKMNLRRHWNEVKLFGDRFWQRWVKEFTPVLTRRTKWFERCPPISVGSVVIIVDENLPRNLWLKGRVTNTIPAKDGQVRRATIKTQHGILDRPATKIAVLDVGLEDGN